MINDRRSLRRLRLFFTFFPYLDTASVFHSDTAAVQTYLLGIDNTRTGNRLCSFTASSTLSPSHLNDNIACGDVKGSRFTVLYLSHYKIIDENIKYTQFSYD